MIEKTGYLIDANVFIQAKNFHYRFDFCAAFWQWLQEGNQTDVIYSIDKVLKELKNGKAEDKVRLWAEAMPGDFFLDDVKDPKVMEEYAQLIQWATTNTHYKQQAKNEFARFEVADAFLIATAKAYDYTLVTHELSNPQSKKRILIPDAANAMQVDSIQIYDLLSQHAKDNFTFSL
ncbi:hypothetical protein BMR02_14640 [Methylococcaceae bacterium HT1]|nr:hypothetical protein BMR02_14640 [Methylococcaceae bacterium HT1]